MLAPFGSGDTVILTAAAAMLGYLWAVGRDDDDVVEDGEPDVIDTAW